MQKKTEETTSNKNLFKDYMILFWEFFKIGAFTIGGGAAMIPQIQQIVVEKKRWLTDEEMLDCIAMSQSLPGVIAVNAATFIGYEKYKTAGAFWATFGVVLPAFLAIVIAVALLDLIKDNAYVTGAFTGVKAAVCGLILVAAIKLIKKPDVFTIIMAAGALIAVGFCNINVVFVILASILIGIIVNTVRTKRLEDGRDEQ